MWLDIKTQKQKQNWSPKLTKSKIKIEDKWTMASSLEWSHLDGGRSEPQRRSVSKLWAGLTPPAICCVRSLVPGGMWEVVFYTGGEEEELRMC